jgi:aryl-alcohol dehydrogenase-like predicted oxidoreductase
MLPTRPIGTTGMEITKVGYGAWAIGGGDWSFGWGHQDDSDSVAAIHRALEGGLNWIDTAPVYGDGHSEDVVRRALDGISEADRPYVFTKCGLLVPPDPYDPPLRVGRAESIRAEVEASLGRLRVERLDLLQVHWPAADVPIEDYWQTLIDLKQEGKVRAIGLSNHSVGELDGAEALGHVDTMQPPFSIINRDAAAEILPWCAEHSTGVIVYSPMQSGLLTGKFSHEHMATLEDRDWRRTDPEFTTGLDASLALVDRIRPIARRLGVEPGALAVAWVLSFAAVTGAIVGARSPAQVDGWLPAAQLELDEGTLTEISDALGATGAGHGPLR